MKKMLLLSLLSLLTSNPILAQENAKAEASRASTPDPNGGSQRRLAIVLDRTGSMLVLRPSTGRTRCVDSLTAARDEVAAFEENFPGSLVSVWTFSSANTLVQISGGYVSPAQARTAISTINPNGCGGQTALADAVCSVADNLAQFPSPTFERQMMIYTDGDENNSIGACAGVNSVSSTPPFDANSWHSKAWLKLGLGAQRPINLNKFWGSSVNRVAEQIPLAPLVASDEAFFRATAEISGGSYAPIPDAQPVPPPFFPSVPLLLQGFENEPQIRLFSTFDDVGSAFAPVAGQNCVLSSSFSAAGWIARNTSIPLGSTCVFAGTSTNLLPQSGISFAAMNFNSVSAPGTIATWLASPVMDFGTSATLEFYIQAPSGQFPDRLEVRTSTTGNANPDFGNGGSVGEFGNLILQVNPTQTNASAVCGANIIDPPGKTINGFPFGNWCKVILTNASGIPNSGRGRIAFLYYVTNAGPLPAPNGNYVGIDSLIFRAR